MTRMPRRQCAPDLTLSGIAYGMWRLTEAPDTTAAATEAKLESCLAQGITTIDQADIYGDYTAEALLGPALRPSLRDQLEIVTKCGIVAPVGRHAAARVKHYDTSETHITASVEASLKALATDRIDLLLIHRPDPFMNPEVTGAALDRLVESGKVRHVGVSNFRPHDMALLQSRMEQPLVTNQIELSLLARAPFTNGDLADLQKRRLTPMAWSPLGGGALVDGSHPALLARLREIGQAHNTDATAVAIAWLLAHPAEIVPVLGSNRTERIARFSEALTVDMDRQSWFELLTLAQGQEVA